jgi:competence protein ComEA
MKKLANVFATVALVAAILLAHNASAEETANGQNMVNINTASATELTYLPGIGMSKAQAIVEYRSAHQFKTVEELVRVKGIGRKTFKKIQPHLTVKGETTAKGKIKISK